MSIENILEASAQDPATLGMTRSEAAMTFTTGVFLPTLDVVTDWLFVARLLSNTIPQNVSGLHCQQKWCSSSSSKMQEKH